MKTLLSIAAGIAFLAMGAFAWIQMLDARSAGDLLGKMQRVRPGATLAEVRQALGPESYTFEAPSFPPWMESSALGSVQRGTVLVYTIKQFHPKLLIIHLLPESGVQFVSWEST